MSTTGPDDPPGDARRTLLERARYVYRTTTRSQRLLLAFLIVFLSITVVSPLVAMVYYSFADGFPASYRLGLDNYATLVAESALLWELTVTTVVYAGATAVIAVLIGFYLSVFVVKFVGATKLHPFIVLPYAVPSISAVTGWVLLLGDAGLVNRALMAALGLDSAPIDVYSLWGMVWVESLHMAPVAFLFITPALRSIPASMEEASYVTGASKPGTYARVIVPVIWPTIVSTLLFIFVRTLATVATPSVLGVRDRIFTYGSAIPFLFLSGTELNYGLAFAFSVFITLVSAAFVLYYLRVQGRNDRHATVTGRGGSDPLTYDPGVGEKLLLYGTTTVYLVVGGLLPFLAIVWSSFTDASLVGVALSPDLLTAEHWLAVLDGDVRGVRAFDRALRNTLLLAVSVPLVAMLASLLVAYANQTLELPFGRLLSFLSSIPLAVPGVSLGLGFLAVFVTTPIYGTRWILFVAFLGMAIPITQRYASPALARIGTESTEASLVSGATEIESFVGITFPYVLEDYLSGWLHGYIAIVRSIPVPILLYAPGSEVLAVELLNILRSGYLKPAATVSVLLTLLSCLPFLGLYYLERGRSDSSPYF